MIILTIVGHNTQPACLTNTLQLCCSKTSPLGQTLMWYMFILAAALVDELTGLDDSCKVRKQVVWDESGYEMAMHYNRS